MSMELHRCNFARLPRIKFPKCFWAAAFEPKVVRTARRCVRVGPCFCFVGLGSRDGRTPKISAYRRSNRPFQHWGKQLLQTQLVKLAEASATFDDCTGSGRMQLGDRDFCNPDLCVRLTSSLWRAGAR